MLESQGQLEIILVYKDNTSDTLWKRGGGMQFLDWRHEHLELSLPNYYQVYATYFKGRNTFQAYRF